MKMPGRIKNYIYIGTIALSIIVIIVLMAGYNSDREKTDVAEPTGVTATLKKKEDKVVVTVSTDTIQDGLSNMGFLVTQEYYFTQVEKYTKEKTILSFITSSSEFMYSYDGSVLAGVDFEKIEINKDDEGKTVTVELPKSEIMTVTIDKDTFRIYSEKDSIWNPLKLEDYNISLSEFEEAAKKKALEEGILERSDEQAKKLVMQFLGNYPALSDYDIKF